MAALKTLGGICIGLALLLVIITLFFFFGIIIRVIAIVAAIIGTVWLIGALMWLGFEELVLEPRRKKKAPK